jgi:hypothetical protein
MVLRGLPPDQPLRPSVASHGIPFIHESQKEIDSKAVS